MAKCAVEDRHSQSIMEKETEDSVQMVHWKLLALTRTAIPGAGEE
jgi:hypothetical protein